MNERIKELAEQAGAYIPGPMGIASGHPAVGFQDLELFEKFAELIVRECRDMFVVNSTSWSLLNEKLEHFGIKE